MKSQTFLTQEEWLEARRGRVTGTRLKDIVVKRGTKPKKAFYELIAERIAIPRDPTENVMDRGHTLESDAVARFTQETGKNVDTSLILWTRDDNDNIAISPDGFIGDTEAVEVKCLNSASHLEAYLTKEIPSEYEMQALQYFIVNDKLQTLYFCFYDPSMPIDFFYHTMHRADVAEKVVEYLEYERGTLAEVERITNELLNF
jgi:putative phage-type endonuclease